MQQPPYHDGSNATNDSPPSVSKVHITFFPNEAAKTLTTETLTLVELAERVLNTSRHAKKSLPWVKLAKFGATRTAKGCLRNDANVQEISGVEVDYDDEKVPFESAMIALQGISALIYTSPSHAPDKPRWRILAPTSRPCQPEMRGKLLARLNGLLKVRLGVDKVAANESHTLSQAYYYGWVCDSPKPDHRAEVISGDFIDLRDDLAEYEAQGAKSGNSANSNSTSDKPSGQEQAHGFDAILLEIGDGGTLKGFNDPLSRAAASYVALHHGHPFDKEKLKSLLRDAINKAPKKPARNPADIQRYLSDAYLNGIIASAERKFVRQSPFTVTDFVAVMSNGQYLFAPTREMWPAKSVNACIAPFPQTNKNGTLKLTKKTKQPIMMPANEWLDRNQRVEQITWVPGQPELIKNRLVADGGWIERRGASIFNLYRPPSLVIDDLPEIVDISPWFQHLSTIYPDDWGHIVRWLAHRVQHPEDKVNHALLLGGSQGIGKDTLLEPIKYAVGPWNFQEINPASMLGSFNSFLRAVILRISEARDLGDVNRFAFYDHMKVVCAAPPDTLRVNEKHLREYYVFNVCGVIITTNYKTGGIYLPPDDRRTYVAWSNVEKEIFSDDYWQALWRWYAEQDGIRKVAAFLRSYDLSSFNAKAPPPRTPAFYEIVASGVAPEEIELTDLIDRMGNPDALTLAQLNIKAHAEGGDLYDLARWLGDRNNRKSVPYKLEQVGYVRVPNPDNPKQGIWNIKTWEVKPCTDIATPVTQRAQVYAKASLSYRDQVKAVRTMIEQSEKADRREADKKAAEQHAKANRYDFNYR